MRVARLKDKMFAWSAYVARRTRIFVRREERTPRYRGAGTSAIYSRCVQRRRKRPSCQRGIGKGTTLFGVQVSASMLVKQYYDAPPGSATRTKMLEAITKLTVQTSEMGASKKPLELWTDDELEEELDKRSKQSRLCTKLSMQPRLNGPVIGAPIDDDIPAEAVEGSGKQRSPRGRAKRSRCTERLRCRRRCTSARRVKSLSLVVIGLANLYRHSWRMLVL